MNCLASKSILYDKTKQKKLKQLEDLFKGEIGLANLIIYKDFFENSFEYLEKNLVEEGKTNFLERIAEMHLVLDIIHTLQFDGTPRCGKDAFII